jgi:hypothetical protein
VLSYFDDNDDDDYNNNNNNNFEKKLKYKNLSVEIQRMWNMKCFFIPVIIGATGIVTRGLKKHTETIPGKHSIDSLQKTAVLGTSHVIRKVLQSET